MSWGTEPLPGVPVCPLCRRSGEEIGRYVETSGRMITLCGLCGWEELVYLPMRECVVIWEMHPDDCTCARGLYTADIDCPFVRLRTP